MNNDKGLLSGSITILIGCCHCHHGSGARAMAGMATDWGIYPLGALGRTDPTASLYGAGQTSA